MKTQILMFYFFCFTLIYSCKSKAPEPEKIYSSNISMPMEESLPPPEERSDFFGADENNQNTWRNHSQNSKKKIIKDGELTLKTKNIQLSKKRVDELAQNMNAYYEIENLENYNYSITYRLKIRIPSLNFEKMIESLENGSDEIENKNIHVRDVTEEFMDIESRLANKRAYLKRYKELLLKSVTIRDIMAIEENVRVLQEEIESKEGRLKYINDQVAYSTLILELEKVKLSAQKTKTDYKFSERVIKSLKIGWKSVINFSLWTLSIWPYLFIYLIVFLILKAIIKKRRNKMDL